MRLIPLVLCAGYAVCGFCGVSDWPSWRGPEDQGSTTKGSYPAKWDSEKVLWKATLPGKGCSTPIVWNERIYVTAPIDGMDGVLSFGWDGKEQWATKLGPENAGRHRNGSGSNPSPVTDGKAVFVYFKSGTLAALNLEGKVTWQTNLVKGFGPDSLYWDQGTSPVLTKDAVVIARMHNGESWLAAFDKATGRMLWKAARNYETPTEGDHAYTTPLLIEHDGKEALLVWGAEHLTAHETSSGKVLWSSGGFNPKKVSNWPSVASPVVAGEMAVVASGRADRRQPRLSGVRMAGSGDVTATHRVWHREDVGTFVPTPAVYKGRVYVLSDRGDVDCIDPKTGNSVWRESLPRSSANYYSSPTVANGILYAIREDGVVFVAKVDERLEVVAENQMGERVIASPVVTGNRLLIRGDRHLFCIDGGQS